MATNRGLPPPAAMTLPSPTQSSSLGHLPDRWNQGTEETQRTWLQAKMEEERRRQEEERRRQEEQRTQQENIRLEVRRTELEMLREALRGGMPAQLVPVIFTGGGAMAGSSAEWASQYVAQIHRETSAQIQQSAPPGPSPEIRRNSRLIAATEYQTPQPAPISGIPRGPPSGTPHHSSTPLHSSHPPPPLPPPPPPPPPPHPGYSPFHMSPRRSSLHPQHHLSTHPDSSQRSTLPRINTDEMHMPPAPQGPPGMHMARQQPQTMPPMHTSPSQGGPPPSAENNRQPQQDSSPSIFFHHWQPPANQNSSSTPNQSTSPPTNKPLDSPFSQHDSRMTDVSNSPKKRKLGSGQVGPNSSGTFGTQYGTTFSPSYSSGSSSQGVNRRRGHTRNRSESTSSRGYEPYPKGSTRPRRSDTGHEYGDSPNGGPPSRHYSISHMTTQDESPELKNREHSHIDTSRETHLKSQQSYSAGSDARRDVFKREGSIAGLAASGR